MQYILIPIISIVITFAGLFGVYNYLPMSAFEPLSFSGPMLGTTITTINGSDTLSASRTTINNNFTALNSGKIEVSSSSIAAITTLSNLTTVGTLTSGALSTGFTAIPVSLGGTGSTSPSQYLVILGNGGSGLTVASSTGTDNQVFTSRGAGLYPGWETYALDQNGTYTWTGANMWTASSTLTATTTISASSVTNGALILNGQAYKWPTSQNASSSVLMTDNAGTLIWGTAFEGVLISSTNGTTTAKVDVAVPSGTRMIVGEYESGTPNWDGDFVLFPTGKTTTTITDPTVTTISFSADVTSGWYHLLCNDTGAGECELNNTTVYFYK